MKPAIFGHAEFTAFNDFAMKLFAQWKKANTPRLKGFTRDGHPKPLIDCLSEDTGIRPTGWLWDQETRSDGETYFKINPRFKQAITETNFLAD